MCAARLERKGMKMKVTDSLFRLTSCLICLAGLVACADIGPRIDDRFTVFTPIFADNRVYYLKPRDAASQTQALEPLGSTKVQPKDEVVRRNSPLSVLLRAIEIPAAKESNGQGGTQESAITEAADYAVILDIGTNADGSTRSIVVWYQRGVQPDQSLNFSNLLVYYEPRWDERVAPYFRIRVMDVSTERNAETRRALERAHNLAGSVGAIAASPLVSPFIGIGFTAAELVFANRQNRMVLDYTVQLYSSAAAGQAGSGELGVLKRGSYIVVGRPLHESRDFWKRKFAFEPESHALLTGNERVNVPTALITVGTFESIVPTIVMERSAALTALLASNGTKSTVEQIDDTAKRLAASVEAFTKGEKLNRYRNDADVDDILRRLQDDKFKLQIGVEDQFFLLRAISQCFKLETPFSSVQEAVDYRLANRKKKCEGA